MDEQFLIDQAKAAAKEIVDRYGWEAAPDSDLEQETIILMLLSVAWIEGRQAGGNEAKALIRRMLGENT
jgi:hypothetical protein